MRIKLQNILLLLNVLAILLIIIITFTPANIWRLILGLPIVLFFPGYTLVAAVFPRRDTLDNIERVALSFALSIVVVPFIGFILNYTPLGIKLYPVLISITIFILTTSAIAWYRWRRLGEVERFTVSLNLRLPTWRGQGFIDKMLLVILVATVLGAIGTLSYIVAVPRVVERFTEFYILGLEGKAVGYPNELVVGEKASVIVRIVNREHEAVSYRLEVRVDGASSNEVVPLVLEYEEVWEETISFTPYTIGNNQKVELLLYKNEESEPYLKPLYLKINVAEPTGIR